MKIMEITQNNELQEEEVNKVFLYAWQLCNIRVISKKVDGALIARIDGLARKTLESNRGVNITKCLHICYFNLIKNEYIK